MVCAAPAHIQHKPLREANRRPNARFYVDLWTNVMNNVRIVGFVMALAAGGSTLSQAAQEKGQQPKDHAWLERFVGEWEWVSSGAKATETARMLGTWMIDEIRIDADSSPVHGMLTVGYDPSKKKYVGTWIDAKTNFLWIYEGTVDSSGNVLTLETEGPNPMVPGKLFKAKDVHTFTDRDHRTLTSSMLGQDGKWHTFQKVQYRRKK
jgi:hypothetical protein